MIPGTALIATVFQESAGIQRWLAAIAAQSECPEEFVIVDGGSTDDTVAQISNYSWPAGFPKPRVIVQRCNIAAGRNLAVRNCAAPVIVATDAGSLTHPDWFREMAQPFAQDEEIAVVAGRSEFVLRNAFQKQLEKYLGDAQASTSENVMPSSRCVAFRREAWAAVGGYPEWLTLTAEDTLFNHNLRAAGLRFHYQPSAIVYWEVRPDLGSYLRMLYGYGYGWAEAGLKSRNFVRWLATSLFPPLILLSRNSIRDVPLRYLRNLASAAGWCMGLIRGHKPPPGWRKVEGIFLSPETMRFVEKKRIGEPANIG